MSGKARKLKRRLRRLEARVAALEGNAGPSEPRDLSAPVDAQAIMRRLSGDYACYVDDEDDWEGWKLTGYL